MKAIMVMFDSLNRHMLPPYGCEWVHAPNFKRLAEKTVTFDTCYVGSMPCMPARRELHTGRYNFLHRSWGPLEPFDDSMPEILKKNGISTHLVSDHYHYWEEGGCTYHTRYSTWDAVRGQEGDFWKADLTKNVHVPENYNEKYRNPKWIHQDWVNRHYMQKEEDQPQPQTFAKGMEFIRTNHAEDNWFLQIETFDPHEPYFCDQKYKNLYKKVHDGPVWDWPMYESVSQSEEEVQQMRNENAALISMCDTYLGKILDMMDEYDLWNDTMLIVNTDHGFLLGEHDWWGKCRMPFYEEIAHTPFFLWDPRCRKRGERRKSLVQTIDIAPTLLEYFGVERSKDMLGKPLRDTIAFDTPVRNAALFGNHGGHVNCTDGRYVYMRAPVSENNEPLFQYTLMPTHMTHTFSVDELKDIQLQEPFSFTKGCRTMKTDASGPGWPRAHEFGTLLFDLQKDPQQKNPLNDSKVEKKMIDHMVQVMKENDAPVEQYERLGLVQK